jgi:hypothetical protein
MEVETQVNLLLAANLLLLTMLVGMTAAQQLQPVLRRWMTLLLVKWSLQRTIRQLQQQNLQPASRRSSNSASRRRGRDPGRAEEARRGR